MKEFLAVSLGGAVMAFLFFRGEPFWSTLALFFFIGVVASIIVAIVRRRT